MSKIDWKQVKKECDRLKIFPKEYYNPFNSNFEPYPWICLLSERSLGKTTGWLLLGMVCNKLFGTVPEYVRLTGEMTKPKALQDLFKTILACGYVEKITDGRWNSVTYFMNRWKYCNIDDDGKIIEKDVNTLFHVYDLCHTNGLKSTYNNPDGDLIILDEFVDNQTPYQDFFFYLCDSMSTVFRTREDCKCVMLSNTINPRSIWFTEMGIVNEVNNCRLGERKLCQCGETTVYLELVINKNVSKVKQTINKLYFGFKNPKLNSITGSDTWAYSQYAIYEKGYTDDDGQYIKYQCDYLARNIFLKCDGFYIQTVICKHEKYGLCVLARPWDIKPREDDIILVPDTPVEMGEHNLRELPELYKVMFSELYNNCKWYYRNNTSAISVRSFISQIKK